MSEKLTTMFEELAAAGRGVLAVLVGDRQAGRHFDLTPRGLVGSFIAFLLLVAFNTTMQMAMGGAAGSAFETVVSLAVVYALQTAATRLVLRQFQRPEGLVPYLVAYNWSTVLVSVALSVLSLIGLGGPLLLILVAIVVLVISVNVLRVIVGLRGGQVALVMLAQIVAAGAGLLVVALLFPASPEEIAALSSSLQ